MPSGTGQDNPGSLPWAHFRVPPFPQVAMRVLQLVRNENAQLHSMADLISSDAAFASEVLTIANSALYAPRYPVHTVQQAIAVLGANHLQGICLTVGVRSYMGKSFRLASLRNLWRHNLACAFIARRLATAGAVDPEDAYTAAILHDIGRFALTTLRPMEYAAILDTHRGPAENLLQQERELFGWDHCEIGRKLVTDWNLPAELESIVADHHCPLCDDGDWNLTEIIKISCRMADAVGFSAAPGSDHPLLSALLLTLPGPVRSLLAGHETSLAPEVEHQVLSIESL